MSRSTCSWASRRAARSSRATYRGRRPPFSAARTSRPGSAPTAPVYGNVTDPDALRPYLPSAGQSKVVVTSTQASALGLGKPTPAAVFTKEEAQEFLAERTRLHDPDGATALAAELGHLPLALAQAAAVSKARRLNYQVYLARLRSYPTGKYLRRAAGDQDPRGVAESILPSIDTVTAADDTGLCGGLLSVVSLLSPDGVSRDLLYLGEGDDVFAVGQERSTRLWPPRGRLPADFRRRRVRPGRARPSTDHARDPGARRSVRQPELFLVQGVHPAGGRG